MCTNVIFPLQFTIPLLVYLSRCLSHYYIHIPKERILKSLFSSVNIIHQMKSFYFLCKRYFFFFFYTSPILLRCLPQLLISKKSYSSELTFPGVNFIQQMNRFIFCSNVTHVLHFTSPLSCLPHAFIYVNIVLSGAYFPVWTFSSKWTDLIFCSTVIFVLHFTKPLTLPSSNIHIQNTVFLRLFSSCEHYPSNEQI